MSSLNPITQVAGPYVPQFEIYWKKLDPENTGKVMFVHWKKVLGRLSKPLYSIKVMWTSTNMFQGGSHGCCTIPQALRPLRPDSGKGWEITKWNCEGVGGGVSRSTILSLLLGQQSDIG